MKVNNKRVVIADNSHIHGDIIELLEEAMSKIKSRSSFIKETVEFDRIIGKTFCVKTSDNDEIYHETREGRKLPSRMVNNREPEPCNKLTIILVRKDYVYQLITTYIGDTAEPEPWDERAFKRSKNYEEAKAKSIDFWEKHALIPEKY